MRLSRRFARSLVLLASPMLTSCSSGQFASDGRVPIPAVDSEIRQPCRDPGIDLNPKVATAQHRRALADCEDKRAAAVEQLDLVKSGFGLQEKR